MKLKKFVKNNVSFIIAFIVGVLLSGGVVYAATVASSDVSYEAPSDSELPDNVQEAIDELYSESNHYYTIGKSATEFVNNYVTENNLAWFAACPYTDRTSLDDCLTYEPYGSTGDCNMTYAQMKTACESSTSCINSCHATRTLFTSCMTTCMPENNYNSSICVTECEKDPGYLSCASSCREAAIQCVDDICEGNNDFFLCLSTAKYNCRKLCNENKACTQSCVDINIPTVCK